MSSKSTDSNSSGEQDRPTESDTNHPAKESTTTAELKIELPEGSQSVSDAIVSHREILNQPQDHGLATEQDIIHLSEAMETYSGEVDEIRNHHDEVESDMAELQTIVERQQDQIKELRQMVTSLAEILGTEAEWRTFDDS